MKILFLQQSSLVEAFRRLQAKSESFKHFASPKGLNFLSSEFKQEKWVGKVPSLR